MTEQPHDIRRGTRRPPSNTEPSTGLVVRLDIPPDHHPAVVKGDSPGAATGRAALTALYEVYGKINDTARQVSDKARLATAAQPFAERALNTAGRALATLAQQIEHLDTMIEQELTPAKNSPQAGEVRAYWRGQPKSIAPLTKLFRSKDATTISAILSAPSYLSGLDDAQQGLLRVIAAETIAPDKVQQRAEAADAARRVEHAMNHFTETIAANLREWRDEDSKIISDNLS